MSETPPTAPPQVADLAEACIRQVRDALGFSLDYSTETLPVLDHYLIEHAAGLKTGTLELVASIAGAYFGEVVRHRLGHVRWHCPEGDYPGFRLEFEPFFLWFNPLGAAMEAIAKEPVQDWNADFQVLDEARQPVAQSLEATEVGPEDYFKLSIRLEALEQVADLLGGLEEKQQKLRHFGPDVYRAAAGDQSPKAGGQPPS